MRRNPFDTLYMTEDIDENQYPAIFSTLLVPETAALFKRGNVVLTGTQGSGKTMLLNLLKPEIRFHYYGLKQSGASDLEFAPDQLGEPFLGCGLNLSKRAAVEFGQRRIRTEDGIEVPLEEYNVYFADFLNYLLVSDLIATVKFHTTAPSQLPDGHVPKAVRGNLDKTVASEFTRLLSTSDCWLGGLDQLSAVEDLSRALSDRIRQYRDFLNFNSDRLPERLQHTKTSAGEPIAKAVELLKHVGAIDEEAIVLVRIDQYDQLLGLEGFNEEVGEHHAGFRSVIHKLLALRDNRVFYRIGTRPYGWPEFPHIQGSTDILERSRNYELVDLNYILSTAEHGTDLFRRFADDVFRRRLVAEGWPTKKRPGELIFGPPTKPEEEADRYVRRSELKLPNHLPTEVRSALADMPAFDGQLGLAWYVQRSNPANKRRAVYVDLPENEVAANLKQMPWRQKANQWWFKERRDIALLQLAAKQQQRLVWRGWSDILTLSGSSILVFLSLCGEIWTKALSDPAFAKSLERSHVAPITTSIQDVGIHETSRQWFQKIAELPRTGVLLQRFITEMAIELRRGMREDEAMSYPGANGFSISRTERLDQADELLVQLLHTGVSYGFLTEREHSDRNGKGTRTKFHLAPILCPYFGIPAVQTKEPRYVRVAELERMVRAAKLGLRSTRPSEKEFIDQQTLFGR